MEVKKFLRNKSIYILLIIIFISFLLINLNVVYFGDDYYYLIMSKENGRILFYTDLFTDSGRLLLKLLFSHYLHANGRLIVHTLVCLFLKMPMIYWQILNSAMLTGICYFGTKVIIPKEKECVRNSV